MGEQIAQEDVSELYEMLTMMRPHGSITEDKFIQRFLTPLGVARDVFGNVYKRVGEAPPVVAWSSHVDTVHKNGGTQAISRSKDYIIKLASKSDSNCLGADDTAGVWLMVQMIRAKKPGLYIFHRGEEVGGQGSKWIVENNASAVNGIQCMVALDRMDNDSVITFQRSQRCCSDDFGNSMSKALGVGAVLKYKLDQGGSFTDSANYTDLIAECTNLSVGYKHQHWKSEQLDLVHLVNLRKALIVLDTETLIIKRKPGDKEQRVYGGYYNEGWSHGNEFGPMYGKNWQGYEGFYEKQFRGGYYVEGKWRGCTYKEWETWKNTKMLREALVKNKDSKKSNVTPITSALNPDAVDPKMLAIIKANPEYLAKMFEAWGFDDAILNDLMWEHVIEKKKVVEDNNATIN